MTREHEGCVVLDPGQYFGELSFILRRVGSIRQKRMLGYSARDFE